MLNKKQYTSSKKYEARIELHKQFRTNPKSKFVWIFEHLPKKENLNVLELGCGTGLFWLANSKTIPKSWSITLSDYSEGMLQSARDTLSKINFHFQYEVVNAENITYPDKQYDIIMANNMLYHLENRQNALSQIHRILKDDGVFIASTMGRNDLFEMHKCLYDFLKTKNITFQFREFPFSLDNGFDQLKKIFASIIIERFDNSLKINEVEPIINYYLSLNGIHNNFIILSDENVEDFRKYLNNIITNKQVISVTKDEGIFICKK